MRFPHWFDDLPARGFFDALVSEHILMREFTNHQSVRSEHSTAWM